MIANEILALRPRIEPFLRLFDECFVNDGTRHGSTTGNRGHMGTGWGQRFRNSVVFERPQRIDGLAVAGFRVVRSEAVVRALLSRGNPATFPESRRSLPASPPRPATRGRSW